MEKLLKEITEQDIADMFNISLEELKKGIEDGTVYGYATEDIDEEIVDRIENIIDKLESIKDSTDKEGLFRKLKKNFDADARC